MFGWFLSCFWRDSNPTRIWEGVDCIVGFFAFSGIQVFGWMLMMLGYVRAFSAASRDGLVPGDVILEVNGSEFPKPGPSAVSEVVDAIKRNPKRYVLLKIKRGEQNFDIRVTPDENFDVYTYIA